MDCLFCGIIAGTIPADKVYEDEECIALKDINSKAPTHLLIIPKKHIPTLHHITDADDYLLGHLMKSAIHIATALKIGDTGYRLVVNCNKGGGQEIFHLHLHLLAGRKFTWPPG